MWSNLFSGAIGSIIGVVGAVVVAYLTVAKTRQHEVALARAGEAAQAVHAERQRQIETSGMLAYNLVALYDELKVIDVRGSVPTDADLAVVRPLASGLVRSIVVDGPLLPSKIETEMKKARATVKSLSTSRSEALTQGEVSAVLAVVKQAGDVLRDFRKSQDR